MIMSIRNSISQIPSKVKETTIDAWTLFTSLMNPDNPQAKERIITWAFGSMSARDLIHVIQTKQDLVIDTEAKINESTFNRHVASGIINAQWNNMTDVLLNPGTILDYFEQYAPDRYPYLNTPEGIAYLNWICPRLYEYLKQFVANGTQK